MLQAHFIMHFHVKIHSLWVKEHFFLKTTHHKKERWVLSLSLSPTLSLSLSAFSLLLHTQTHTQMWVQKKKSTSSCLRSQCFLTSKCIIRNQTTQCANIIYLVKPHSTIDVTGGQKSESRQTAVALPIMEFLVWGLIDRIMYTCQYFKAA